MDEKKLRVFIAGGTGYLGSHLIPELITRGHEISLLVRPGSEHKAPAGCTKVAGNALEEESYKESVKSHHTFVHLVGVPHPSPAKAPLFRSIDLPAVHASVAAAKYAEIKHFVYLSVAHPASVMKAYVQSRMEAEELIRSANLNATMLRPWYVLGPGHRWAYALLPFYKLFELIPPTRATARRLGLVNLKQMIAALVNAVEQPCQGIRIIDVPKIREAHLERGYPPPVDS